MQVNGTAKVLWIIISIILVRYLYLKGLDTPQQFPISNLIFTLIPLKHFDDTDLNVLNIEEKHTIEVIKLGQKILDSW